ncbi:unnamed protein product, partial [Urochloa humidicola]
RPPDLGGASTSAKSPRRLLLRTLLRLLRRLLLRPLLRRLLVGTRSVAGRGGFPSAPSLPPPRGARRRRRRSVSLSMSPAPRRARSCHTSSPATHPPLPDEIDYIERAKSNVNADYTEMDEYMDTLNEASVDIFGEDLVDEAQGVGRADSSMSAAAAPPPCPASQQETSSPTLLYP